MKIYYVINKTLMYYAWSGNVVFLFDDSNLSWYDVIINSSRVTLFLYFVVALFKLIYNTLKLKFKIRRTIKMLLSLAFVVSSSIYLDNKYTYQIEPQIINDFRICKDECVSISLTELEKFDLEREISNFNFKATKCPVYINDLTKIYINNILINYEFFDSTIYGFMDDDLYILTVEYNKGYYEKTYKNPNEFTRVINKYLDEFSDTLINDS